MVRLGLALLLAFVSAPLVRTVVAQIGLMTPQALEPRVCDALQSEIQRSPLMANLWRVLLDLSRDTDAGPALTALQRSDRANGLGVCLELLPLLRRHREPTATRPADVDVRIRGVLKQCQTARPARLHAADERKLAERALQGAGLSPREIAVQTHRIQYVIPGVRGSCMPVLRELADLLLEKAAIWRSAGRGDDAAAACRVLVQLLTDVLDDSPSPEMALLASEELPPALRGLGAEAEARRVEAFCRRWHDLAREDRINLLPWTGDYVLARKAHDRVLRSLAASALTIGVWLTLAATCALSLLIVVATHPPAELPCRWRWNGHGAWVAPAIACGPLILLLAVMALADIRFTWLVSYPSLWPALLLLVPVLVSSGLATRLCVRPAARFGACLIPGAAVWGIASLLVLAIVAGAIFLPLHTEDWRPPPGIQRFRQLGYLVGVGCVLVVIVWILWGTMQRRRAKLPAGVWARANLAVASAALLAVSVVSMATLGINQLNDLRHRQAFIEAAGDPIADRLGENWGQEYFAPARAFAETPADS